MKKLFTILMFALVTAIVIPACGGGGGGGGADQVPLVDGLFVKEVIGTGGASSASSMFSTEPECRYMFLLPASHVKGSGTINSISFKYNAVSAAATFNGVTIKMGHTGVATLSNTFASNIETAGGGKGSFTTVFNGTLNIPAGTAGSYFTIPLTTPFYYNGTDNIVIEVSRDEVLTPPTGVVLTTHIGDSTPANIYTVYSGSSATSLTGTTAYTYPDIKLNFGGGDEKIYYGTTSTTMPFSDNTDFQRVQVLYKASELNGSGSITGIALAIGATTTAYDYTVTIRMGHTTDAALAYSSGTTTWSTYFNSGTPETVANAVTFSVPGGLPAGTYIWLPLTSAFTYNGTDNLIVDVNVTNASAGAVTSLQIGTGGTNTVLDGSGSAPVASGGGRFNVKLRFYGSSTDVITAGTDEDVYPFNGDYNPKIQYLYRSGELGTGGSVTSVWLRLQNNSIASTYSNFTVVLGHKTGASLGLTFADNMTGATTVYSGDFLIPSGLKEGDWIEIPLTTPFNYDITKNLVVQMSASAGTGSVTNGLMIRGDAALYPSRHAYTNNNTSGTASSANDYLADIRLKIE